MKDDLRTVRFTCSGWFYRGGEEVDCRHVHSVSDCATYRRSLLGYCLEITGTDQEIQHEFLRRGWKVPLYARTQNGWGTSDPLESCEHLCPQEHHNDQSR